MATVHFRCPPPPMPVSPPPAIQSKRTWTRSIAHRRRCRRRDSIAPAHTKGTAPRIQSLPGDVLRGASRMRLAGWTRRGREPADECIPMSAYRYYEFLAVARSLARRTRNERPSVHLVTGRNHPDQRHRRVRLRRPEDRSHRSPGAVLRRVRPCIALEHPPTCPPAPTRGHDSRGHRALLRPG